MFSMLKVTDPAETLEGSAPTANSWSVISTSSPPPPHPAATRPSPKIETMISRRSIALSLPDVGRS